MLPYDLQGSWRLYQSIACTHFPNIPRVTSYRLSLQSTELAELEGSRWGRQHPQQAYRVVPHRRLDASEGLSNSALSLNVPEARVPGYLAAVTTPELFECILITHRCLPRQAITVQPLVKPALPPPPLPTLSLHHQLHHLRLIRSTLASTNPSNDTVRNRRCPGREHQLRPKYRHVLPNLLWVLQEAAQCEHERPEEFEPICRYILDAISLLERVQDGCRRPSRTSSASAREGEVKSRRIYTAHLARAQGETELERSSPQYS